MEKYISPKVIKQIIYRTEDIQTQLIIFFIYNYGMRPIDILKLSRRNFIIKDQKIRIQFQRIKTATNHVFKIPDYFVQTIYKHIVKRKDNEPLFKGTNKKRMTEVTLENRLFQETLKQNKNLASETLWNSHLYWVFRKRYTLEEAIKEYNITKNSKAWKIWDDANCEKCSYPRLLDI
ncbi:tyrosine-type recombinase/integrase [Halosquirtibacter laminarini]|uniref:Tyrosine-type recombinase/integrase n=1 Tax=Halosquirtibacter laminarini TaxID=3374600 RepID=A0AC61NLA8_9BACT|nr:tyrosine-type recombinase/integrase [Prolixibacteraceae bacterium]